MKQNSGEESGTQNNKHKHEYGVQCAKFYKLKETTYYSRIMVGYF